MIVSEHFSTTSDGVELVRTYSDAGFMIEREGIRYSEAIDPANLNRVYIETDEYTETEEPMTETEMKAKAYDIITGVE